MLKETPLSLRTISTRFTKDTINGKIPRAAEQIINFLTQSNEL